MVSEEALPDVDVSQCPKILVTDYLGRVDSFPKVKCYLRCPYFDGFVEAVRAPIKFCSVLVGNVEGALVPDQNNEKTRLQISSHQNTLDAPKMVQDVQTRNQSKRKIHHLVLPDLQALNITPQEFSKLQHSCLSLRPLHQKASTGEEECTRSGSTFIYELINGLLYRVCRSSNHQDKVGKKVLVVPAVWYCPSPTRCHCQDTSLIKKQNVKLVTSSSGQLWGLMFKLSVSLVINANDCLLEGKCGPYL